MASLAGQKSATFSLGGDFHKTTNDATTLVDEARRPKYR